MKGGLKMNIEDVATLSEEELAKTMRDAVLVGDSISALGLASVYERVWAEKFIPYNSSSEKYYKVRLHAALTSAHALAKSGAIHQGNLSKNLSERAIGAIIGLCKTTEHNMNYYLSDGKRDVKNSCVLGFSPGLDNAIKYAKEGLGYARLPTELHEKHVEEEKTLDEDIRKQGHLSGLMDDFRLAEKKQEFENFQALFNEKLGEAGKLYAECKRKYEKY